MKWDLQSNSGNSTKSVRVKELIKKVKRAEVRRVKLQQHGVQWNYQNFTN